MRDDPLSQARAYWVSEDTIVWPAAPDGSITLHGGPEGPGLPLQRDPGELPPPLREKLPHLAGMPVWKIRPEDRPRVPGLLKGPVWVSARDGGDATGLQIQGVLDDLYTYEGPLGAAFGPGNVPTLRVWAPTARSVRLHLFADAGPATAAAVVPMRNDPATGVWSATGAADWYGRYYLYEVEVWVRGLGVVTNRVTDPYSVSLAKNSRRSQILSLADPAAKPAGWDSLVEPRLDGFEDVVLYELHVRDFSAGDPTVPEPLRGTFKAFTLTDSLGMRHLRSLAEAGLTHLHLLPVFDFATVDEERARWRLPEGDLAGFPPDSEEQQARVSAVADLDGYNWGFDPWHYTVPEGSYAVEPEGAARVREFREMVQALHGVGLRVVMDVVYNHTYAAGQDEQSVLDRIVPGYYHRLNADGEVETSSCCPNTASEFNMMEKLMIDSVVTWARDHRIDGFRFDLMGHHMKRNLERVRAALDALTPPRDGVDGAKVFLYGEGWSFGEVAGNARGVQASQLNLAGTGIASFNDRLRDGVRLGLMSCSERDRLLQCADWIRVGLAGNLAAHPLKDRFGNAVTGSGIDYHGQPAGYARDPQEVISYVEAHDNETLFDVIQLQVPPSTGMADRVRLQNLGMSLVGLGQGVPFFHAGGELLRSKSLDRNSYNSGDWFNRLDLTRTANNWGVGLPPARENQGNWPRHRPLLADPALRPGPQDIAAAYAHFLEILGIRKSCRLLRLPTGHEVIDRLRFHNTGPDQIPGLLAFTVTDATGAVDPHCRLVAVVFNATGEARSLTVGELAGEPLVLHPLQARSADPLVRTAAFDRATGTFSVPALTTAVFWASRESN